MLLASLSLAGAPLVTSGFWSKDAIFAAVLESGYVHAWPLFGIATIVAMMTAFYTFRMIGMAFFGKKSKYLDEMEKRGHHLHEVGPNMWVPFAILASCDNSNRRCRLYIWSSNYPLPWRISCALFWNWKTSAFCRS